GARHPSAYRPPGYPYLLALVYRIRGDSVGAGQVLSALLGTLAVMLLMLLAERLWDRRVAVAAGLIAAVYLPLIAVQARALLSESLFVPAMLAALLLTLRFFTSGR